MLLTSFRLYNSKVLNLIIIIQSGRKFIMKKLLMMLMALCLFAGLMAGCGGGDKKAAAPQKVLKVATEPTFAPFEFQKEGSKDFDGFDMDLITFWIETIFIT